MNHWTYCGILCSIGNIGRFPQFWQDDETTNASTDGKIHVAYQVQFNEFNDGFDQS